jgi:hypothetical protein
MPTFALLAAVLAGAVAPTHVTVVAAGDIARCDGTGDSQTAAVISRIGPDAVLTLGDDAYPTGSAADFSGCYAPTWGAFRAITYPAPGNHEYATPGAAGYFGYFSVPPYYSVNLGAWHVVSLNSEIDHGADSAQLRWLRRDLARDTHRCELLYWHRPRWSGGVHGSQADVQPFWRAASDAGVDLVLAGHDHNYQRFRRLGAAGRPNPLGVRSLVVGTGGASHYAPGAIAHRQAANGTDYGVLKLVLRPRDYDLAFVHVTGGTFRDSLRGQACHQTRPR